MAQELGISLSELRQRVDQLHEMNPMLGHRGCRLAVTYPEILDTQVTAIVEAVIHCRNKGINARPEIMIPLVGTAKELQKLSQRARETIDTVKKVKKYEAELNIPIGTMIEVPRAAVTADEIASLADFFSFGTNDLTQMTFGVSRDDVNTFLPDYLRQEILLRDPFQSLDTRGVGQLVEMAVNKGRLIKPKLKCGVCGEHAGDPDSIHFFNRVGLNYVSCSPFRVPTARLAAAQAALAAAT
jgi:pyruvate,orthophosphate dikinase